MKNLQKTLLVLALTVAYIGADAQSFVIKAGANFSNALAKDNDGTYSDDFKARTGFNVGATVLFPLSDVISLETGLMLNTRGFRIEEDIQGTTFKFNFNPLYLDIPILAKGTFALNDNMNIFAAAGPYLAFGIGGKTKFEGGGQTDEEDIKFGSGTEDDLKGFDFGLSLGAGVEFGAFQVGVSYDLGLANLAIDTTDGEQEKNRVFRVGVGYIINR